MEGVKWEDLSTDLLVDIFKRVGMESLLLDVPLVCKSWYKATLDPICWQHINFPKYITPCCAWDYILTPYPGRIINEYGHRHYLYGLTEIGCPFPISAFIKYVVNRSHKFATGLSLTICCHDEALFYAADQCAGLKSLYIDVAERCSRFHVRPIEKMRIISGMLSKWKNLEALYFSRGMLVDGIVVSAIVNASLPKLKYLVLEGAEFYDREYIVMILQGCKEIVHVDVRNCIGFSCYDAEILKLASHIPVFMCEGSVRGN